MCNRLQYLLIFLCFKCLVWISNEVWEAECIWCFACSLINFAQSKSDTTVSRVNVYVQFRANRSLQTKVVFDVLAP
jgi:hypothetical protein